LNERILKKDGTLSISQMWHIIVTLLGTMQNDHKVHGSYPTWGTNTHKNILAYIYSHFLCKLDRFINISNTCCSAMKRPSLQEKVGKFAPKKFYEIDPWIQPYKEGANLPALYVS
jgi:hypothetical protein